MNDLFLKRMESKGSYVGRAIKLQSDDIMDETFFNDAHTVPVRVYYPHKGIDKNTYAKFQISSKSSIVKDQEEYHVQFRTKEHYPIGCYIDIPDDTDTIRTWLLVDRNENPQFVKYSVLPCNWTFRWIAKGKIYSCLGTIRNRNSYNSGVKFRLSYLVISR